MAVVTDRLTASPSSTFLNVQFFQQAITALGPGPAGGSIIAGSPDQDESDWVAMSARKPHFLERQIRYNGVWLDAACGLRTSQVRGAFIKQTP